MNKKYHPIEQSKINNYYHLIHQIQIELAFYLNNYAYDFDFIIRDKIFIEIFQLLLINFDIKKLKIEIMEIIHKNNCLKHKYCFLRGQNGLFERIKKIINNNKIIHIERANNENSHEVYDNATNYLPIFKKHNGVHYGYLAIKKISSESDYKEIHLLIKNYFDIYLIKSEKRAIPIDGLSIKKIEWFIPFIGIENIFTINKIRYERNFALNEIIKLISNNLLKNSSKIIFFNDKYAEIIKYYDGFISYEDAVNFNIFYNKSVKNLLLTNLVNMLISNPDFTMQHIGFNIEHQIVICDPYPALLVDNKSQDFIEINRIKNLQKKLEDLFSMLENGKCSIVKNNIEIEYTNLEKFINEYFIEIHIGNLLSEKEILEEINIIINSFEKNFHQIKTYSDFIGKTIVEEDNKNFQYTGKIYDYTERLFSLFIKLKSLLKIKIS